MRARRTSGQSCMAALVLVVVADVLMCRLIKIKEWIETREPKATIIPFSAVFESKVCHSSHASTHALMACA